MGSCGLGSVYVLLEVPRATCERNFDMWLLFDFVDLGDGLWLQYLPSGLRRVPQE